MSDYCGACGQAEHDLPWDCDLAACPECGSEELTTETFTSTGPPGSGYRLTCPEGHLVHYEFREYTLEQVR